MASVSASGGTSALAAAPVMLPESVRGRRGVLPSGRPSKGARSMQGGGMAVVERAGPWWERSLLRVRAAGPFSERSLRPGPGPFFELSLRLGGDMRLERRLRPGGDMASVVTSGGPAWTLAAVLGGGTCDAGGVSSTANAAGDAVVVKSAPGGRGS